MPPKQSPTSTSKPPAKRGRPSGGASSGAAANKRRSVGGASASATVVSDDEPASRRQQQRGHSDDDDEEEEDEDEDEEDERKTIPRGLLTRLLHECFQKEGTRITRDADAAVWKYVDTFVREAIARSAEERGRGDFLEVEDLEKIAPQLLTDM